MLATPVIFQETPLRRVSTTEVGAYVKRVLSFLRWAPAVWASAPGLRPAAWWVDREAELLGALERLSWAATTAR